MKKKGYYTDIYTYIIISNEGRRRKKKSQPKLLVLFICGSKYGIIHKITIMSLLTNIKSNFPPLLFNCKLMSIKLEMITSTRFNY